jgi:hypothetical protein
MILIRTGNSLRMKRWVDLYRGFLKQGQVETNSGCELRREIGYLLIYPRVFVWN